MKYGLRTIAAACLIAATSTVSANSYGSISISNISVTLIDLDPADGIAASIFFLPDTVKYAGGAYIEGVAQTGQAFGTDPGNKYDSFYRSGAWASSNVSKTVHSDLATASASVTGSATGAGFTELSLSGSALSSSTQGAYFLVEAKVPGALFDEKEFVLSANTKVVFSFDAALSVNTNIGHVPGAANSESAMAEVLLYTAGLAPDGVSLIEDLQGRKVDIAYQDGDPPGGAADSWSGVMSASFSNVSDASAEGVFGAHAETTGFSVISAVPEPSTWGMLLAGLGMLGGVARRRRAAHPTSNRR